MHAIAGSRWRVGRFQLIDERLPEDSGLRSEHCCRVALDQVPVMVFEFQRQIYRRPAGISQIETYVFLRFLAQE